MVRLASAAVRAPQRHSRRYTDGVCGRCGLAVKVAPKHVVCSPCETVLTNEARAQQERAYLHSYLFTRADDTSPTVRRLRQHALAVGLDWRKTPPVPVMFADRLAALLAAFRQQLESVQAIA